MGVWIETPFHDFCMTILWCHTLRGVWIETTESLLGMNRSRSHPTWVCGLKHQWPSIRQYRRWLHPAWEYMDWSIVHSSVKFMEEL